ncbi:porin [Roseibium sp. CAU 1637]|uniref:Porin n=1 Tax=Roseibium limicola TaxID=2816037 RepID=A0A939EMS0_9HYPH|nr:porin [Roseibium limicola]MBO0345015.1 porin [Roseibium limicola]
MNFKSLMLAAAAATAVTGAHAADLPVAPEPVDYVKVCDAYGARFYYIPGTDTCLRVGGRIRAQYQLNDMTDGGAWATTASDGYEFLGRGYLYLDSRTATEWGLLRTFFELEASAAAGAEGAANVNKAFIQWGGFTFGYATSFFDYFTGQTFVGIVDRDYSDQTTNLIAYTAAFGNGFSATLSVEEGGFREVGTYDGQRYPDLVAALEVSQGWGGAKLAGALHHVNMTGTPDEDMGYAIQGGVVINLPMLTSGSNIAFQAAYADGALSYLNAAGYDGLAGSTSSGFNVGGGIYIQATPTVGLALDGSYLDVDLASTANDYNKWAIDGSVMWEPVSGFALGVDVGYSETDFDVTGDTDTLAAAFRVQRTF